MAALGWLLNLGFAGGTAEVELATTIGPTIRRGPSAADTVPPRRLSRTDSIVRRAPHTSTDTTIRRLTDSE